MDDDIVRDFFRRVQTVATGIPDAEWRRLEVELRAEWGGARLYIAKGPAEGKAWRVGTLVAAGAPIHDCFAVAGVSRSYGFRLLSRRWRVR